MSTAKFAKQVKKHFDAARTAIDAAEAEALKVLSASEEAEEEVVEEEEEEVVEGRVLYWEEGEPSDLDSMSLKDLKELAAELEFDLSTKGKKNIEQARTEIYEAFAPEDEDAEEDEDAGEDEDEDEAEVSTVVIVDDEEIDLSTLNVAKLKKFAKDNGIEVSTNSKPDLIQEIIDALYAEATEDEDEDEGEEGEEDFDPEEAYGLSEMDVEELASILQEHGLSVKGKRQALVDRIVKAIDDGTIEVGEEEEGE